MNPHEDISDGHKLYELIYVEVILMHRARILVQVTTCLFYNILYFVYYS